MAHTRMHSFLRWVSCCVWLFGVALGLVGCAVRPLVLDTAADALAAQGHSEEDDLLLAREASAFYLKLSESVLRETPGNLKLAESVAGGFTQYAYAFVAFDAEQMESKDAKAAQKIRERAARLYGRAFAHAMAALEKSQPGFKQALVAHDPQLVARFKHSQVGVAYWAAASWGGLISLSKDDPDKVADLPLVIDLATLAWKKDPGYAQGGLTSLMGTLEASRPGGSVALAQTYFDQAITQGQGLRAGPWVAKAENIALPRQDRTQFTQCLQEAIRISQIQRNLENEVMRARALWLLDMADDLF